MKGVEAKRNLLTLMRTMLLVEHVRSAQVQVIGSWRLVDPIFDNLRVRHTGKQFRLLLRKGVHRYEYVDDREKFEENCLPPPPNQSVLRQTQLSECDYGHARRVWREFGRKDLGDYHC